MGGIFHPSFPPSLPLSVFFWLPGLLANSNPTIPDSSVIAAPRATQPKVPGAKSNLERLISCLTSRDYWVQDGIWTDEEGLKLPRTQRSRQDIYVTGRLSGSEVHHWPLAYCLHRSHPQPEQHRAVKKIIQRTTLLWLHLLINRWIHSRHLRLLSLSLTQLPQRLSYITDKWTLKQHRQLSYVSGFPMEAWKRTHANAIPPTPSPFSGRLSRDDHNHCFPWRVIMMPHHSDLSILAPYEEQQEAQRKLSPFLSNAGRLPFTLPWYEEWPLNLTTQFCNQ